MSDTGTSGPDRLRRIAAFRSELADLERAGVLVLTGDQRRRLDAYLAGATEGRGESTSESVRVGVESVARIAWGMRLAALLGGAALVAAGVLFLHRVWGTIGTATQVLVLTVLPLVMLAAAVWAQRRGVDRFYVLLPALAAGVGWVLGSQALAATLAVGPPVDLLLVWGAFGWLVGHAFRLRLVIAAGLMLLCAYTGAAWVWARGGYWAFLMSQTQVLLPAAGIVYLVPGLRERASWGGLDHIYRACGAFVGMLALLLYSEWGTACCTFWTPSRMEGISQIAGLGIAVGVVIHGMSLQRGLLVHLGAAGFVAFLFARLHAWWWERMPKYLFFLMLALIALSLLMVLRRLESRWRRRSLP